MNLTTAIYTTPSSAYIREIMSRWLMRYIWWMVAVLAASAVLAALVDTAFLFVALMLVFIVFPSLLVFVYFNYGTKPRAMRWNFPRRLTIDRDGIRVTYYPNPDYPDRRVPETETYPLRSLRGVSMDTHADIISTGPNLDDFIIVPAEAFASDDIQGLETFRQFLLTTLRRA